MEPSASIFLSAVSIVIAIIGTSLAHSRWQRNREERLFEKVSEQISKKFHDLRNDLNGVRSSLDSDIRRTEAKLQDHEVHIAEAYISRIEVKSDLAEIRKDLAGLRASMELWARGSAGAE